LVYCRRRCQTHPLGIEIDLTQRTWTAQSHLNKNWQSRTWQALFTEEPIYWPSDNKKIPNLLDFGIIKSIAKNCCHAEFCLELFLSRDHSPVIFLIINSKIMTKNKPCTLCNIKTNWLYFQGLLKTTGQLYSIENRRRSLIQLNTLTK